MKTYIWHADPGHAWLEVSSADLVDVGLTPADFTSYSYRNAAGTRFYLEEDQDAGVFIAALGDSFDSADRHVNGDSFIRGLDRIGEQRP